MSYFKSLFYTKSLPDWFVTLNFIDVTFAFVSWPFVVFMSMVAFMPDPETGKSVTAMSHTFDSIAFLVIISYPIFIILMMILNFRLYHKHRNTSIVLSVLPILIAAITGSYYYYPYL